MANDYYNRPTTLDRNTLGRAEQVNAIFQAIADGFDKLPDELPLKQGRVGYVTDTGAADAYVVSMAHPPSSYTEGLRLTMKAANANTGASTVDVDSLGVKAIKRYDGSDLQANDIRAGAVVDLVYQGTHFVLVSGEGQFNDLAEDWASKTGATVDGSEYSAKEHAVGTTVPAGSSRDWATETGTSPDGAEYAAKEYAQGDLEGHGGSSKAWAQDSLSPDGSGAKSAKTLAGEASTSASNASTSETNAAASETNAAASEAKAADWADEAEDVEVEAGKFSARHWSEKAKQFRQIGEVFAIQTDIAGSVEPDNSGSVKFIKLTAGLTGAGQYNEGLLTSESVSGASPTVTATAVIDHVDSPMDGQTVRLINTEERFLRAGNAGVTQGSQNDSHNHGGSTGNNGAHSHSINLGSNSSGTANSAIRADDVIASYNVSQGDHGHGISSDGGAEARPRNVGVDYYMRIA